MSIKENRISVLIILSCSLLMMSFILPSYAEPVTKPTSGGTLNISFTTDPAAPTTTDQTQLKINFLNKQGTTQQHIDYKVSVMQGSNQVFGIPVTHTAEGVVSIPFQFQTAGTYQITVQVEGILFNPIPPETAVFNVDVGGSNSSATVPEFGPMAGAIIAISIISAIVITKQNRSNP